MLELQLGLEELFPTNFPVVWSFTPASAFEKFVVGTGRVREGVQSFSLETSEEETDDIEATFRSVLDLFQITKETKEKKERVVFTELLWLDKVL